MVGFDIFATSMHSPGGPPEVGDFLVPKTSEMNVSEPVGIKNAQEQLLIPFEREVTAV